MARPDVMPETDLIALAYCAGIIDGEGTIVLNKRGGRRNHALYRRPVLQVAMTAEPVIRFLQDTFGGYVSLRPRRTTDMYEWRIIGEHALTVLTLVQPFLREPRKVARAAFLLSTSFAAEQADKKFTSPAKEARRAAVYDQFHAL